jgi:chemotaxis protein MotB
MALATGRRRDRGGLDAWPGYVDALSTLLMVLIFCLLVFVLAQAFLSVALSTRDRALDRLNRQVAELSELLSLERGQTEELRSSLGRTVEELRAAADARDLALRNLTGLREERDRFAMERDALRGERDRLSARIADLDLASRGGAERIAELESRLAEALSRAEAAGGDAAQTVRNLSETRRLLATERSAREAADRDLAQQRREAEAMAAELAAARHDLAALREEAARLDRQVTTDRATIEARLSDVARLSEQVRALTALRDQLERQAEQALARADAQAAEYGRLSESARAQVALLTRQLDAVREELARVAAALDASEAASRDKDAQISALGQRLNVALAARVEELQGYRSDFFGRLRRVLGDRPEVRIVGDRFVFQSEVLFAVGSAELTPTGERQIRDLARVLLEISQQIPADIGWVLRVDGHADRTPIRSARFASNWELSSARAIAVAQMLIQEGLPANRVAATAFGDTQPLDDRDTPDAFARNRRIELRLTDR